MDLGSFSITKRLPRDNHILTKAEGTLHKRGGKLFWVSQVTAWEVQTGHYKTHLARRFGDDLW